MFISIFLNSPFLHKNAYNSGMFLKCLMLCGDNGVAGVLVTW